MNAFDLSAHNSYFNLYSSCSLIGHSIGRLNIPRNHSNSTTNPIRESSQHFRDRILTTSHFTSTKSIDIESIHVTYTNRLGSPPHQPSSVTSIQNAVLRSCPHNAESATRNEQKTNRRKQKSIREAKSRCSAGCV